MKMRNGFVSNSSSSSFVVLLNEMTDEQKEVFKSKVPNTYEGWEAITGYCIEYGIASFSSSGKVYGGHCDQEVYSHVWSILNEMGCVEHMESLEQ